MFGDGFAWAGVQVQKCIWFLDCVRLLGFGLIVGIEFGWFRCGMVSWVGLVGVELSWI